MGGPGRDRFLHGRGGPWHGLVTYYVLVVMDLATRQVQIVGTITRFGAMTMSPLTVVKGDDHP